MHTVFSLKYCICMSGFLGNVSINKKTLKVMEFSKLGHGGGGRFYQISITFFREKNVFFHKKSKVDRNGLTEDFNFSILGGQGKNPDC